MSVSGMKIDAHGLVVDESKSNPMMAAFVYPNCPMPDKKPCFYMAVGFGSVLEICSHFVQIPNNEDEAECLYKKEE